MTFIKIEELTPGDASYKIDFTPNIVTLSLLFAEKLLFICLIPII